MNDKNDQFQILRKIKKDSFFSQRELAQEVGFSLGKLNYCLKALQKKGLIKFKNFKNTKNKVKKLKYIITPKGISERTKITLEFMKKKMKEYDELKNEFDKNS